MSQTLQMWAGVGNSNTSHWRCRRCKHQPVSSSAVDFKLSVCDADVMDEERTCPQALQWWRLLVMELNGS